MAASSRLDTTGFASFGPGQLRAGREGDALDGIIPQAVITAREVDHVRAAIDQARSQRMGIVIAGGATELSIGNAPQAYDIRLGLTGIAEILERNPDDMTVTAQAGVTLARLGRNLEPLGQRLAIDVADPDRATIGGVVAADTSGGLAYGYGRPRDLVLGMSVVDGRSRAYACGAKVVKNVAGYDLPRLFTGSRGTLAVITEVTLRTHPIPPFAATAFFEMENGQAADKLRAALFDAALPLAALDLAVEVGARGPSYTIVIRAEGTETEVAAMIDGVVGLAGVDPSGIVDDWLSPADAGGDAAVVIRLGLPPSKLLAGIAELTSLASSAGVRASGGAHLAAGVLRLGIAPDQADFGRRFLDGARTIALRGRGTAVLERGSASLKAAGDVFGPAPASVALMRELKTRFDPDGVLGRGRGVGGL
ncbi:MAG: glycolate oxidase FAD binding subunit [Hyphomicrobiaceae bacterium]